MIDSRWQALVKVGVATVVTVTVLNGYKWAILSNLGFPVSRRICENANAMRNYLNQGGNPNAVVRYVFHRTIDFDITASLLECAVTHGNKNTVQLLNPKSAGANARGIENNSASETMQWLKTVKLLIAKGADVKPKSERGATPLHMARSLEMAQFLIAEGADVNAKSEHGTTPLHGAGARSLEMAQFLIDKGADVRAKAKDGKTPLHYVRSLKVAQLLIAHGADVNAKDRHGKTLLRWAPGMSKSAAELLKSHGAKW